MAKVNYFTNLDAWRIERSQAGAGISRRYGPAPLMDDDPGAGEEFEDLPADPRHFYSTVTDLARFRG
ncbi:MAG: hypothetical protein R2744_08970 [Bacteroidales bacterium]